MENRSYGMLVVAGLVALGAIGVAVATTYFAGDTSGLQPVAVVDTAAQPTSGDADNDGVPDWKEVLWGTDPHNPDSDSDGIGDAEEIAAASSKLADTTAAANAYTAPKALPATEALARELYVGYAAASEDGTLTSSEIDGVVSNVLARNSFQPKSAPQYTTSDFTHSDSVSVVTYNAALLTTLQKTGDVHEYELSTFGQVVESGDTSGLTTLAQAGSIYRDVVAALLKISVPNSLATEHLAAVNSLSKLAEATTGLSEWSGDPLEAMNLVNAFALAEDDFASSMKTLYARINNLQ